jgi:hypothetical protein
MKLEVSRQFFEKYSIPNIVKIRPEGAELFHADKRTEMTKLIVSFRNFANAPKYPLPTSHYVYATIKVLTQALLKNQVQAILENAVLAELTNPKYSGTGFFRNIGNYLPLDTANTPEDLNLSSASTLQRTTA